MKAIVLDVLLKEVEAPELLESLAYRERLKYANLMLHLMSGEQITSQSGWYPDKSQYKCSYYFDPSHRYNPFL